MPQVKPSAATSNEFRYGHGLHLAQAGIETSCIPMCTGQVTHPAGVMYFKMVLLTHCLEGLGANAIKAHISACVRACVCPVPHTPNFNLVEEHAATASSQLQHLN